jgi:anti-sigma regulatory factor (Ser/Thr protein kinase)
MAFDVDLLLREFLNNAVVHGNLSNPQKNVRVQLQLGFFWLKIVVEDEGKGFPWRKRLNFKPKPTETTGRGLIIGVQYSHRIRFNRQGNHVSLWLKIKK